eukprot:scaffold71438_cov20-Prasinocladus_malaysianus.AAC.1
MDGSMDGRMDRWMDKGMVNAGMNEKRKNDSMNGIGPRSSALKTSRIASLAGSQDKLVVLLSGPSLVPTL